MIYFVVPRDQEFGIRDYLETWGTNIVGLLSVIHYEDLPRLTTLPAGTWIFSALDQLTPGGVGLVLELQAQLRAALGADRVLNDPRKVLLRYQLLEALHRRGLNQHRAIRATGDPAGLTFPVFLHEEFQHTGSLSPLLHTRAELDAALGRAALRGYRLDQLLVIEFCDTADGQGRYRKYTAYVVGRQVFARGMARGHAWMLKADRVEFSEEMLLEERAYVLGNPWEEELREIFDVAGTEYGRIDFAVKDGRIETWEINTNPSVGPTRHKVMPDEFAPLRQPIRNHFSVRFRAALEALDPALPAEPVPVSYSAPGLRAAASMVIVPRGPGILVRVAEVLGPLRPLLDRAARLLSPLLARASRRVR